jgi:hypothetical protein
MNLILATVLLPLQFTAPADTLGTDAMGRWRLSALPVHAYVFHRLGAGGTPIEIAGYADPMGKSILLPHSPGTKETVWISPGAGQGGITVFVLSRDLNGNLSEPSNGCVLGAQVAASPAAAGRSARTALEVPLIEQSPERCGPAALEMVLRYYGATPRALSEVAGAYDPVLRGSLITDLAGAARRAGYRAAIETLTPESVIDLLHQGVPPILLYQNGKGPVTVRHFGVVTGWDETRKTFTLNDGRARPRVARREDLAKQWVTAGSQALVIRLGMP